MNLHTQLDGISKLAGEGVLKPEVLLTELRQSLSMLGFEEFAAITANNFNTIQRSLTTFAGNDKFFGRELKSVFEQDIIAQSYEMSGPVIKPCGLALKSPFDQVWVNNKAITHFLLLHIYKDRFTHGYFVVLGDGEHRFTANASWQLAALAQMTIDLMRLLPVAGAENKTLTDNEIAVLRWTYEAKTAEEVADILQAKRRTVNYYINCAIKKLQAKNKIQAAMRAKEQGLF